MNCKGIHCPGCGDGGGSVLALAAVVVVVALVAAKAHAIEHGATELVHVLIVVAITAICLAAATVAVIVAVRFRRAATRVDQAADRAAVATAKLTVPASLANPFNSHLVTCQCQPCALYWDSAAGRIAYLMAAGQPVPDGLWRAVERQDRQLTARTIHGGIER